MLRRFLLLGVLCVFVVSDDRPRTYTIYETTQKIIDDGFPSETHHVTTSDGYILEMHRIPHGRTVEYAMEKKPVVFLMHGLLSASNSFIGLGPDYSFAYNLADAGFDVWMGNNRGNKNSRYHITLDPDDEQEKFLFFDYSFEEIGMYDLPAMIDYVLNYTGREKLHYIGHSQGGTVFLVMGSMVPEYNQKLASVHLLAGVGYMQNFPDDELRQLALTTDIIYGMAINLGVVELYPPNSTEMVPEGLLPGGLFPATMSRTADSCTGNPETNYMCNLFGVRHILRTDLFAYITDDTTDGTTVNTNETATEAITNAITEAETEGTTQTVTEATAAATNTETDTTEEFNPFEDYLPAGASLKQIAHYGQNIRDRRFRRYHHGTFGNLGVYGSFTPPSYNLRLITANVTMHYSLNDTLLDERDVLAMVADMPNAVARKVARESFLHEDYVVALDAKELVTDYIIEAIKMSEDEENQATDNEEFIAVTEPSSSSTEGQSVVTEDSPSDQDSVTDMPVVVTDSEVIIEQGISTSSPVFVIDSPSADSGCMTAAMLQLYLGVFTLYLMLA